MSVRPGKRSRSILATGALTAGLLGGALATAPSASAWTYLGHCSGGQMISYSATSFQWIKVPAVRYDGLNNMRCWMDYGSTGNGVKVLQLTLKTCYGRSIAVDGDFGPATRDALKYAQKYEGISVDGQYGEQTFWNLKWARYKPDGTRNGCAYNTL
ncbi:peptidoglycan-binding domain-containing protein [Streptomyces sp. NPDC057620]|uniref:peptidoglycan-binding domain-containing protein n=1 Tax=Streptomyces sp. NPDC057620 TaxID=3346185 RepID=UPI0036914A7B